MPTAAEILNFAEELIVRWGLIIVPIGAFLENSVVLGFIFPGITIIFLSGFAARTADVSLPLIIALATFGAFLGDNLDYFIGKRAGNLLETKPLFAKPVAAVKPILEKHGIWAIFGGRFSGWSRAWIALACGIVRYPYWRFAIVSAVSALTWTSIWVVGGYLLGGNRELIEQWLTRGSILAWLIFVVLLIYYFRTRIKLVVDIILFASKKYGRRVKNGIRQQ